MKILFNLVSAQTAPNYIAVKELNPDKIILLNTSATQNHSKWLDSALNINSDNYTIDAFNFSAIYEKIKSVVSKLNNGNELILNFTGGTKIMSFAAIRVFDEFNLASVYIDSENNKMLYFPDNKVFYQREIKCRIPVEDYFKIYGHEIILSEVQNDEINLEDKTKLKTFLSNNLKIYIEFIAGYAREINKFKSYFNKDQSFTHKESFLQWTFRDSNLKIIFQRSGVSHKFEFNGNGKELSKYITGGWFEEVCFDKIIESKVFDEVLLNVKFPDAKNTPTIKNELDIVAVKNDTLYIFECKSGEIKQDFIYKLKSIKENYGGTYAKIMFLSYFPVGDVNNLERIKDYNIRLVLFNNLNKFLTEIDTSKSLRNINL